MKLELSNVPEGATLSDGSHNFVATTGNTTVDISSWNLSNLSVTASEHSDQDFTLTVTATSTEAENSHQNSRTDFINVTVNAVADIPTLTVPATILVDEDTQSGAFAIHTALVDTDGSESLRVEASQLPVGATISDGTSSFTSTAGNTVVDISNWSLGTLTITPPVNSDDNFAVTITATATESANSDQATKSDSIAVVVSAVADVPTLIVPATITVDEDTASATFSVTASVADASEVLALEVSDLPIGTTLSDGTNNFTATSGNTSVDISDWNGGTLTVTPAVDNDVDFTLTVSATATDGIDSAVTNDTIDVVVNAVADQPTLTVPATIVVDEDAQTAAFSINSTLTDSDGSETLQLTIGDLPIGVTITDGVNTFTASSGNTSVNVTSWNCNQLRLTPAADSDMDFNLTVTATAEEAANGHQSQNTGSIDVVVQAVADQPNLSVPATLTVDEDTRSATFTISSALTDTDGSEDLRLEISDVPVGATLSDGVHTFVASSGTTTVNVSDWALNKLTITAPINSDEDFRLTVTATATEAANSDQAIRVDEIDVTVNAVADTPNLVVAPTVVVDEDTQSATFAISSTLTDTDGSETLQLEISGLPPGATLSDGSHTFVATAGNTTVDITGWALGDLTITPPTNSDQDFALSVTATATESANGVTAVQVDTVNVQVTAVADMPTLTVPATIAVNEDTPSVDFSIAAALTDVDGSETLELTISDVPAGTTLTDGSNTFTATAGITTVDITGWDRNTLRVTAPADSDQDFTLTVTATATEAANADQAVQTAAIDVQVTAVADQPSLTVPATVYVNEDTQSATFAISSALPDSDGSETLQLTISAIPVGTTLSDGSHLFVATTGSTTVDVTGWALGNLTIQPAADSDVDFTLIVTATATEAANSDLASNVDTIDVQVTAVADQASLTVPSTVTVDEDTQTAAFAIVSALADTDGSETLRLEVSDVPVGAVLSDGVNTFISTVGNTKIDVTFWTLTNLAITPPLDSDIDFLLTVTATATESANGDAAVNTDSIAIQVTAVADQPSLTVPSTITVDEDTQSAAFTIASSLADTDGSETLVLRIQNVPVGATLTDGANTFTASAGNQTVNVTTWSLTSLTVTPPTNSDEDFTLTVVATAIEGANSDQNSQMETIHVEVAAVADQPLLTVPASIAVNEDTPSASFAIVAALADNDGSETLQLEVANVPLGVAISDGTNTFVSSTGNTTVDITNWSLENLTVTPAADSDQDFVLSVTATAVEAANSDQYVTTDTIVVAVTADADLPTLTVPSTVTVDEDTNSAVFAISSALVDTDGSETLLISVSDIPVGATLSDGGNSFVASLGNTSVDVTNWSLANLMVRPAANSDVDFTLTVTSTSTEAGNGDQATATDSIDVVVNPVADAPSLTVPSTVTVDEDTTSASFAIAAGLTDTDGSETLTVLLNNLPVGVQLTDGVHIFTATAGNQQVNVTTWSLTSLRLTPPVDSDQDFALTVTATATEAENNDQASRVDSINVQVNATADQPNLTVPATIAVDEDTESGPFAISASLADTDGSETLDLQISDIPAGITISDGSHVFTAASGNTAVNISTWSLNDLTITPSENSDVDFTLTVTATATEANGGDQAIRSDTIDVIVTAVADAPHLTVPSTINVDEDTSSATFSIAAALQDQDGSETLSIVVSDLPVGATIGDSSHVFTAATGSTSVDISTWNLTQLSIIPPTNSSADFTFRVTATATEAANSDQAMTVDEIDVQVTAIADQPNLTVPSTLNPPVNEDTPSSPFTIEAELTGAAGTETLTIEVSDIPVGALLTDGTEVFIATIGNTTVDITDWVLTNLTITPPANSDVDFSLTVTATATEIANGDQVSRVDSINVNVAAVADQPALTVPSTININEDTPSASFTVSAALQDTDGSETLTLQIMNIPWGATLSDGVNTFVSNSGNTTATITGWNLNNLAITPPPNSDVDFSLTVRAISVEAANNDQAVITDQINVQVAAVADQPTLAVPATVTVNEDTHSGAFSIVTHLLDTDGSEQLLLQVSNIPIGTQLTDGSNVFTASPGNTTADISAWNLSNLSVRPPANSDVDFALTVTATATEMENSDQSIRTDFIHVEVNAVADQPTLVVPATIAVNEDTQTASFAINAALVDTDTSESLAINMANLPVGTTLSDGSNSFVASVGNTAVDVSTWALGTLTITPAVNSDQDFTLQISATTTEAANLDQSQRLDSIHVIVTAVADEPTLIVPATITLDEDTQSAPFTITSALNDSDGSETLRLRVSNIPVGTKLSDGVFTFVATSSNTAVNVTDWNLNNLTITAAEHSDSDFVLTVTATTTEAENGDAAVNTDSINVVVTAVADQPLLTVPATITVDEDTQSATFAIATALVDTDGSESLTLEMSGVPEGAILTDGVLTFTATSGNTTVNITNWSLATLAITPPADADDDFTLTVTATATEAANSVQSAATDTIAIEVNAAADLPTLSVPATITVDEDTRSAAFRITSQLIDTDGSETLTLTVSGIPVGAVISDGVNTFTGSTGSTTVDVSDWDLASLFITPVADSDADFGLTVTATAEEGENGDKAAQSNTINVVVQAVADQPLLTVPASVSVNEDNTTAVFSISAALVDADGSETLDIELSDVPIGATLTDGTHTFTGTVGNTSVDVTGWNLTNLSVAPPADSDVDFRLTVTVTATEAANTNRASTVDTIDVQITAIADQPTLTVPSTITVNEDTRSAAFTVNSAVTDLDGSESLKLEVSGIPVGATLSDGPNSFVAVTGFTMVDISSWDLNALTVTAPPNSDVDFILNVTATSQEADNGDQATKSDTIRVEVTAVADLPTLTVPGTITINEDTQTAAFTIASSLTDNDGSETLLLEIDGLPIGGDPE